MKRLAILWVAAGTAVCPASAQLFGPESLTGGLFGAFIGGIAGADCRHSFSGEGAAIGAGVGLLAGALIGEANRASETRYGYGYSYAPTYYYPPASAPAAQPGYGYVETPVYAPAPVVYAPPPPRPNYAVGGTLSGALVGGLIGASDGHGWEGAGIGAAAGLVVGGVAETAVRKQEQRSWAAAQRPAYVAPPATTPAPPQTAVKTQSAPQTQASSPPSPQVYWAVTTPPPAQIPDAPRVPDAPTF